MHINNILIILHKVKQKVKLLIYMFIEYIVCVCLCVKGCGSALGHVWNRQKDLSAVSITETNNKQNKLYNHLFIKNINNILLDT